MQLVRLLEAAYALRVTPFYWHVNAVHCRIHEDALGKMGEEMSKRFVEDCNEALKPVQDQYRRDLLASVSADLERDLESEPVSIN